MVKQGIVRRVAYSILAVLVWFFGSLVRTLASLRSRFTTKETERIEALKTVRDTSRSYDEWCAASEELDILEGRVEWKRRPESHLYDHNELQHRTSLLRGLAEIGDVQSIVSSLRSGLLRTIGGINNVKLYEETNIGTKYLIDDYVAEICRQLQYVRDVEVPGMSLTEKLRFFSETRHSYGRTALLLSGGASLGMYHLGIVKGLYEQGMLPKIISGASAGSLVASLVCTRTDAEMKGIFEPGELRMDAFDKLEGGGSSVRRKLRRLFTKGVLFDITVLEDVVKQNVGQLTFKEAFERTGRILNITVASTGPHERPRLLNYLTAPDVLIWSAACASCALVGLYESVPLMSKDRDGKARMYHPSGLKWTDGSVGGDLPITRLSELFNVNHFIVSQVNAHMVVFAGGERNKQTGIWANLKFVVQSELRHRVFQLLQLGFLPRVMSFLYPLVAQSYQGDITIVPDAHLEDLLNIVSNPSPDFQRRATLVSERALWRRFAQIRNQVLIELVLNECTLELQARLAERFGTEDVLEVVAED